MSLISSPSFLVLPPFVMLLPPIFCYGLGFVFAGSAHAKLHLANSQSPCALGLGQNGQRVCRVSIVDLAAAYVVQPPCAVFAPCGCGCAGSWPHLLELRALAASRSFSDSCFVIFTNSYGVASMGKTSPILPGKLRQPSKSVRDLNTDCPRFPSHA